MTLTEKVKEVALLSGLDLVGIASADVFEGYRWGHLIMRNPKLSMPEVKSLVIVAVCDLKKLKEPQVTERKGKVARSYAVGHEYTLVDELSPIKELLEGYGHKAHISPNRLAQSMIPLKLAAVRAGLGWQGKHSVVITPEYGSWVTFGGLVTDAPLDMIAYIRQDCGRCAACLITANGSVRLRTLWPSTCLDGFWIPWSIAMISRTN
jgi:epoxyqueuosine reductase